MLVKSTSDVETNFVSIERCLEYAEIETEAEWIVKNNRPDPKWPADGAIDFNNYSTRYRDGLPLVVKNISIQILPGEKVSGSGSEINGARELNRVFESLHSSRILVCMIHRMRELQYSSHM